MRAEELERLIAGDLKEWKDYVLKYPLTGLHQAQDPNFRRDVLMPNGMTVSAVLVIVGQDQLPHWMLLIGLYSVSSLPLTDRPGLPVASWPAVYRDLIKSAARRILMRMGEGDIQASIRPTAYTLRRVLSGGEARAALENMKYSLLDRKVAPGENSIIRTN